MWERSKERAMTTLRPKMHTSISADLTGTTSTNPQKPQVGRGILHAFGLLELLAAGDAVA